MTSENLKKCLSKRNTRNTYLFTNERGIKCCSVDMSREQSNITLAPLNCRTRHGAELVLPREYCKTKWYSAQNLPTESYYNKLNKERLSFLTSFIFRLYFPKRLKLPPGLAAILNYRMQPLDKNTMLTSLKHFNVT